MDVEKCLTNYGLRFQERINADVIRNSNQLTAFQVSVNHQDRGTSSLLTTVV